MDIFYIFLIAAAVGLIYFNFERIKLALKSVNNKICTIRIVWSLYFVYSAITLLLVDGFGGIALISVLPVHIVLLALFTYFFERGYSLALLLVCIIVIDNLLLFVNLDYSPSYLLIELFLNSMYPVIN